MTVQELITRLYQVAGTRGHNILKVRVQKDEHEYAIEDVALTENYGEGHYVVIVL